MPILNRIRIANVSYDGKYIMDQLFDTYGGVNTLFNLANGSGKSVLVQMMLQPILPCHRIHDRRIDSYLSKNNSPTYIMLEWKLDNTNKPIYFLTGIAMCSIAQDDETGSRVKYFTFTHKYEAATKYDIANTPLIEMVGGGYKYMPYGEAYNLLKGVKDELRPLNCFARDRSEAYQQNLEEHGIFAKEWKLLARVNNREGGVDEVFSDCKSSESLLNKWILKTISENAGLEEQKLREMFIALMSSILEQEETLRDKEIFSGFLGEIDRLADSLSGLCSCLDELGKIEKLLAGLYVHISKRVSSIDEEKQVCQETEQNHKNAIRKIDYERLSKSWHHADDQYKHCTDMLEKYKSVTESQLLQSTQAKKDRETMEAAKYWEIISEADAHIKALFEQLEKLKEWLAEQETQDILFSLDRHYNEAILQTQASIEGLSGKIDDLIDKIQRNKDENALIDKEQGKLRVRLGSLEEKQANFNTFEDNVNKTLNIDIRRTLTYELSDDEVVVIRKSFDEESNRFKLFGEKLAKQLVDGSERRDALLNGQKGLVDQLLTISRQIESKKQEWGKYIEAEEALNEIAARSGVSELIGEIPRSIAAIRQRATQLKTEHAKWNAQLLYQLDTLARFDSNSLHTAPAYGELLKQKGIHYITGEDYLKGMDTDRQKMALSQNPMLPFCFLVGKSDFKKATSLYADGIDRLCPVMVMENAEDDLNAGDNAVSLSEYGRAMCYYFEESFSQSTKESFREQLEESISKIKKRCEHWLGELEQLGKDQGFLETFPYNKETKRILSAELGKIESEEKSIKERIESEAREAAELQASCDGLRDDISKNQRAQETAESNIGMFRDYLYRNDEYIVNLKEHQRIMAKLDELDRQHQNNINAIDYSIYLLEGTRIEKSDANRTLESLKQKQCGIIAPESGSLLDWPINVLEERYAEIRNKQSRSEENIQQQISNQRANKNDAEKSLKKYRHIPDHEIERVKYSEDRLELLEQEEQRTALMLKEAEIEQGKANEKYIRADQDLKIRRENIEKAGWSEILPRSEVKGDFDARLAEINSKLIELGRKLEDLTTERDQCQRDINRILRVIESPSNIVTDTPEGGWKSVDIGKQALLHKEKERELIKQRTTAAEIEQETKNSFKGQHMSIDKVLDTLSISSSDIDYSTCYFMFERLIEQRKLLNETVRVLESLLEHLSSQKENVIHHAFSQGKKLHLELRKISESSRVKLHPDKPKQLTLHIGIPAELDQFANERIKNHVDACIAEMRRLKKEGELSEKTIRSIIDTKLSDREILNQTIGQHTIDVQLLKVDTSHEHSKLRSWERVITDNSGGEMFVSCFVLLSALMDYSRKRLLPEDTINSGAKVMLIDNPFGKTSSDHLLDALTKVAKQFNMQMICLSELSQSSITAKFPLIYQLSLRPAMYSGKSYLRTDEVIKNNDLHKDSRLEHVSMQQVQMSLF